MKIKNTFVDKTNLIEQDLVEKLYLDKVSNSKEWSYLLKMGILLVRDYEETKSEPSIEFAYYIFLKYGYLTRDYRPLFDFATNFGYYPISSKLYTMQPCIFDNFSASYAINVINEKYRTQDYVNTLEQKRAEEQLEVLDSEADDVSYIAPTSFGKSNSIIKLVKRNLSKNVLILEPSRALLGQMTESLHSEFPEKKILIHEEMYNGEDDFIAVLTQERAIRFVTRHPNINFNLVCIDEAHNIFNGDSRSLILTILIKWLKEKGDSKFYYYSPVISDSNTLRFNKKHRINEVRINFNLKEAEIYECRKNNKVYKYNRFANIHYFIKNEQNYLTYIKETSLGKNFIYIGTPRRIEKFAKVFSMADLPLIDSMSIKELTTILKIHVNEKFYLCEFLQKGIIYLHAKLPDIIKEYLLYKYKTLPEIRYLIANTVILEGMNLPIEALFIMYTRFLNEKHLINLIGRVNRLNYVFSEQNLQLNKLLPPVHFVDTEEWNSKNSKIENTIEKLANITKDKVENPLLPDFNATTTAKKEEQKRAKEMQDSILHDASSDKEKLKKIFYKYGLNKFYKSVSDNFFNRLEEMIILHKENADMNTIECLADIFVRPFEMLISDLEFVRMKNDAAIKYYERYYDFFSTALLAEKIKLMYKFIKKGPKLFFIGEQYGEIASANSKRIVYIDKTKKSDEELINIAIAKVKMEDDFLSYTLSNFLSFMYELEIINEQTFNYYTYGFKDEKLIQYIKVGIPGFILNMLKTDGQIVNITIDNSGIVLGNEEFKKYKETKDNFLQFHLDKYIK